MLRGVGGLDADVARGIALRHDWRPQYHSAHFLSSIGWLGIADDPEFLGEPETMRVDCWLLSAPLGA